MCILPRRILLCSPVCLQNPARSYVNLKDMLEGVLGYKKVEIPYVPMGSKVKKGAAAHTTRSYVCFMCLDVVELEIRYVVMVVKCSYE